MSEQKETRGVKSGTKRGTYQKKDTNREDIEALFKRVQALEDGQLKNGTERPPVLESQRAEATSSKEETEDWL